MMLLDEYRATFLSSDTGKVVLADILSHCHFGCSLDASDPQGVAEHNLGVFILSRCGVFSEGTFPQVLNALSAVQPEAKQEVEG